MRRAGAATTETGRPGANSPDLDSGVARLSAEVTEMSSALSHPAAMSKSYYLADDPLR